MPLTVLGACPRPGWPPGAGTPAGLLLLPRVLRDELVNAAQQLLQLPLRLVASDVDFPPSHRRPCNALVVDTLPRRLHMRLLRAPSSATSASLGSQQSPGSACPHRLPVGEQASRASSSWRSGPSAASHFLGALLHLGSAAWSLPRGGRAAWLDGGGLLLLTTISRRCRARPAPSTSASCKRSGPGAFLVNLGRPQCPLEGVRVGAAARGPRVGPVPPRLFQHWRGARGARSRRDQTGTTSTSPELSGGRRVGAVVAPGPAAS